MIKLIQSIIAIAILSVVLGVLIPGLLMYFNHDFDEQDVVNNMDSSSKHKYELNLIEQNQYEERKNQLLRRIRDSGSISPEQINQITSAIENIEKIKKSSKKISISAFYPRNKTLALWPMLYFGFGCIVFLQGINLPGKLKKRNLLALFLLIFIFWRSTTWFRNTPLGQVNRVLYSANNIDISTFGFFLQEVLSTGSLIMLSYIVCKWLAFADYLKENLASSTDYSLISESLRSVYKNWQATSLFMAIGFGYYTYYFWSIINDTHDMRYLPQAIIIHFIWGLSWFSISWPLIISTEIHSQFREKMIRKAYSFNASKAQLESVDYMYKNDPVSAQNQIITTLISGFAFLFPLIKSFF